MTRKQLEKAQKHIDKTSLAWFAPERETLRAIAMMHSLLVYGYATTQPDIPYPERQPYLEAYERTLGIEKMKKLWGEQVADFRKAVVIDLGNGYKDCKWADEQ